MYKAIPALDLTAAEVELLIHAANMGGWLSVGYVDMSSVQPAFKRLQSRTPKPFVFKRQGGSRYELTPAGKGLVRQIKAQAG